MIGVWDSSRWSISLFSISEIAICEAKLDYVEVVPLWYNYCEEDKFCGMLLGRA